MYMWEVDKMICFDKLWETMRQKEITTYKLIKYHNFSPSQIQRLKRNQCVSTYTLNRLYNILTCVIKDIAQYREDEL